MFGKGHGKEFIIGVYDIGLPCNDFLDDPIMKATGHIGIGEELETARLDMIHTILVKRSSFWTNGEHSHLMAHGLEDLSLVEDNGGYTSNVGEVKVSGDEDFHAQQHSLEAYTILSSR